MRRPFHRSALKGLGRTPGLAVRGLINAYRYTLSALVGAYCRHLPSCSVYADEAIDRFGLWAGGWMTLARLCRCHPFGTHGLDFVPLRPPPRARWYLPWRYGRWRGTNAAAPAATDEAAPDGPSHAIERGCHNSGKSLRKGC